MGDCSAPNAGPLSEMLSGDSHIDTARFTSGRMWQYETALRPRRCYLAARPLLSRDRKGAVRLCAPQCFLKSEIITINAKGELSSFLPFLIRVHLCASVAIIDSGSVTLKAWPNDSQNAINARWPAPAPT